MSRLSAPAGEFLLLGDHLRGHRRNLPRVVHLLDRGPCFHGLLETFEASAVTTT
jgi:hypothetical protein